MSKVCPLLFASPVDGIEWECRPDRCAWALGNGCAVVVIANCLDSLAEDGIVTLSQGGDDE